MGLIQFRSCCGDMFLDLAVYFDVFLSVGPMTLKFILIPSFLLVSHTQTVCCIILDSPDVFVEFLVRCVAHSCQSDIENVQKRKFNNFYAVIFNLSTPSGFFTYRQV